MGNVRRIWQAAPREGAGAVIAVRDGRGTDALRVLGSPNARCFDTAFIAAGEPVAFTHLDASPDVCEEPRDCDCIVVRSGGKMRCGYEAFIGHLSELSPFLHDAQWFVADDDGCFDEIQVRDGTLWFRRIGMGYFGYAEQVMDDWRSRIAEGWMLAGP